MRNIILLCSFICLSFAEAKTQSAHFNRTTYPALEKFGSADVSQIEDTYLPQLIHAETPDVPSHIYRLYLHDLKKEISVLHPKNDEVFVQTRGDVDPPEVEAGFIVNGVQGGIPLDNHLAMSGDTIVSAMNSVVSIQSSTGGFIKNFSLYNLASEFGFDPQNPRLFDPRLIFDPVEKKYIAVFLHNTSSTTSRIVVLFSETSDANGVWHAYLLPGNPNMDNTWTDYPMVTVTEEDLIVTVNLLRDGESWQLGFEESLIWQLDKTAGYLGEDIGMTLWDDVNFDGLPIRNLCPVEAATETPLQSVRFLSNRNFDIENDTIFYLHLTGAHDDPNANLEVDFILSDFPYGVPPNAEQNGDPLQTNDARVLEAFIIEDQIQFVGNTRNLDNNKCGIFHGVISNVDAGNNLALTHIIGADFEIGYPGIIYSGDGLDERDAIIAFNHTSPTRNPGMSAMYFLPEEGYSDIINIVDGAAPLEMIGSLERWGDYFGTQRNYDDPDFAWVAGFHTLGNGNNHPYIASLKRPQPFSSTDEQLDLKLSNPYPNPTVDRFSIEFNIPDGTQQLDISLLDTNGRLIDQLYRARPNKFGKSEFSFNVSSLASGIYQMVIRLDNESSVSKKIIID